jgi:hypothetical protein
MDQDRLDDLENRVIHMEEGNGWDEWGKYVLKKLDTLNEDNKEHRKELCKKIDDFEEQNAISHREFHRKLDAQNNLYADRPLQCAKNFVQSRTIHWLIIILAVVIGGMFTVGIAHITGPEEYSKQVIEQQVDKEAYDILVDKPLNELEKTH